MAFRDSGFSTANPYTPNLVGKLVDVQLDSSNVMKNKIVIEADPNDNLNVHSGTYTLTLDSSKSVADRMKYADKAKAKGNGFCGSLINEWTVRMKGRKLMVEGVNLNENKSGTASWVSSYKHERLRRPAIIHTMEETTAADQNNDVRKNVKIYAVSVYQSEGFDLSDEDRLDQLKQRADKLYERATVPLHTQNTDGKTVLRSSMPIAEMAFAIQDLDTNQVIEYSGFFATKEPSESEYPEHFSAEERNGFRGKPKRLPRTGEDFAKLAKKFNEFAEQSYPERNIRTIGFEGQRLKATMKGQDNPFMYGEKKGFGNTRVTPLQQMHQANYTKFRMSQDKPSEMTRGVLHPDVSIQFSPNTQDTYNRYINIQYEYLPSDYQDKPWIASMKIDGQPILLAPELIDAAENALKQSGQQGQGQAPIQSSPGERTANNQANPPEEQKPQPQRSQPNPPEDPAFSQSDALDQEADDHNTRMQAYEEQNMPTQTLNSEHAQDISAHTPPQKKTRPAPAPLPDTYTDSALSFDVLTENPFGSSAPGS
jgi:hypothetical protein